MTMMLATLLLVLAAHASPAASAAACASSIRGIMAPFAVYFSGAALDGNAAKFNFTLAAYPDTAVNDATAAPQNIYCQQLQYYPKLKPRVRPPKPASNACCSRAAAGAPARLALTLDAKCAARRGLDALAVLLDGVAIPRSGGQDGGGFTVSGETVEVPLAGWVAGAAGGDARGVLTLMLPGSNPCVAASSAALFGPCPEHDGCKYDLATSPVAGQKLSACCRASGGTWDPFAPPQLRSRDSHGAENMTERYLVIGDVGMTVDGDHDWDSYGKPLPPFTADTRRSTAPWLVGQHEVARQLAKAAEYLRPANIINVGDNFYMLGLNGTAVSKMFDLTFRRPYMLYSSLANVTWLSVLGNHDIIEYVSYIQTYAGPSQPFAECTPNIVPSATLADCMAAKGGACWSPWFQTTAAVRDPRWRLEYDVWTAGKDRLLQLTFLNSNPIVYPENTFPDLYTYVPAGLASMNATQYLADLTAAIQPPPPPAPFRWRAAVAHHPLRDFGPHCVSPDAPFPTYTSECILMQPAAQAARNAGLHLWLNGHDHAQEVIALNASSGSPGRGTTWAVTTGAGCNYYTLTAMKGQQPPGLVWPVMGSTTCGSHAGPNRRAPRQYWSDQGFVGLGVTSDKLVIQAYSAATVKKCTRNRKWVRDNAGLAFNKLLRREDYA